MWFKHPHGLLRYFSWTQKQIIDELFLVDTKWVRIFQCLKEYLNKHNIPFRNITDGAPPIVSICRGFASLRNMYYLLTSCEENKKTRWQNYIKSINKFKAYALNSQLFGKLCKKDEMINQLLLYVKVRWLSRGTETC